MLNSIFRTVTSAEFITSAEMDAQSPIIPVINIDLSKTTEIVTLLDYLYNNFIASGEFCISLEIATSAGQTDFTNILLLLSHPHYKKINTRYIIFINGSASNSNSLKRWLSCQGYNHFCIFNMHIESTNKTLTKNFRFLNTQSEVFITADFFSFYNDYLLSKYHPAEIFVLSGTVFSNLKEFVKKCMELDERINDENQIFFNLLKKYKNSFDISEKLIQKTYHLQETVNIQNELLNLRNKSSEVKDILKFYHKEYEVLPLWFKRLGHIIKIIYGRREFKLWKKRH